MKVFLLISAVTAAVIVTVTARPTFDPDLQDIVAIATQACPEDNTTIQMLSQSNEDILLEELQAEVLETLDEVNSTLSLLKSWQVNGMNYTTLSFHIPDISHTQLNAEQTSRLRQLLLMSSYVHFLKSQVDDAASFSTLITSQICVLSRKINNVAVIFSELLPMVTCDAIRTYIDEDIRGHMIINNNVDSSIKRIVFYCNLEAMFQVFQAIATLF